MGLGRFGGGAGAARFLCRRGARVLVTDLRRAEELPEAREALAGLDVEWVLGEHRGADFEGADLVVANPAVAAEHPLLALARSRGARVTTEVELFLAELPCPAAAVTGTQGKSSTTSFTAQLLEAGGLRAHAGGNLGGSLLDQLDTIRPGDRVVLELSSYQLEHLARPPVAARGLGAAAVVNLLPDHLERHGNLAAYGAAKGRIFELLAPGGLAILPAEEPLFAAWPLPPSVRRFEIETWARPRDASRPAPDRLGLKPGPDGAPWFHLGARAVAPVASLPLPDFQRPNALVALALALELGADLPDPARALGALRAPDHRLSDLGPHLGRRVLDNGVSTTPDSTIAALEAVGSVATLVLGGQAKRLDYAPLARVVAERCGEAVVFGASGADLERQLLAAGLGAARVTRVAGVAEAAREALARTPVGGALLFSPACASFDAHANFKERALAFAAALRDAVSTQSGAAAIGSRGEAPGHPANP